MRPEQSIHLVQENDHIPTTVCIPEFPRQRKHSSDRLVGIAQERCLDYGRDPDIEEEAVTCARDSLRPVNQT